MVLSYAGHPRGLLQSSGGRVDRMLFASALSSIRAMCPKMNRINGEGELMEQPAITKVQLEKWPLKRSVCVCAMWPKMVRRCHWTIAMSLTCLLSLRRVPPLFQH